MIATAASLLAPGFLQQMARRVTSDDFVAQHRTLADVQIGFRDSETGQSAWIAVKQQSVEVGDVGRAPFTFVGDTSAMRDLANGFPFNRLVRQRRLAVEGDLRACVQNWLLIYAVLRLCVQREV